MEFGFHLGCLSVHLHLRHLVNQASLDFLKIKLPICRHTFPCSLEEALSLRRSEILPVRQGLHVHPAVKKASDVVACAALQLHMSLLADHFGRIRRHRLLASTAVGIQTVPLQLRPVESLYRLTVGKRAWSRWGWRLIPWICLWHICRRRLSRLSWHSMRRLSCRWPFCELLGAICCLLWPFCELLGAICRLLGIRLSLMSQRWVSKLVIRQQLWHFHCRCTESSIYLGPLDATVFVYTS